jgi:hypothetical protein
MQNTTFYAEIDAITDDQFNAEWAETVAGMSDDDIEAEIECARHAKIDREISAILAAAPGLRETLTAAQGIQ